MELFQYLSLIATMIGSAYYIHREIHEDMRTQTERTDKLYQMFIELLREGKK
jgi:hypothetical protein